ncbi:Growth arrest-specific protein 7 [Sciurus carolinensis]|uniref:Growth arrest-specific protein 7 n=1 Tax=Sciurus carolinensis TaxID=30640 RepID=A0AA41SSP5_SCICA|nr:Growth arrest-specific protein 7 [Sciurus carolinensis]
MAGFELLLFKPLKAKQMQKEMSEFIQERTKIEEEYARNLGEACVHMKNILADEEEVHLKFSTKHHSEVGKPLMNICENFKKDMKKCDYHNGDL